MTSTNIKPIAELTAPVNLSRQLAALDPNLATTMTHTLSDETRRRLALGLVICPPANRNRRRRLLLQRLHAALIAALYQI